MNDALFKAEKDSLAFIGLMSRAHMLFDHPIPVGGQKVPTHYAGLNIHACIIDNPDGELLAVDRNAIHATQNPMDHGEQRTLRSAVSRVLAKRPRPPNATVEDYYRSQMFMAAGDTEADYLRCGATCYTSLEPCPMCASTLLVCRVKRVVFVLPDPAYGGAWPDFSSSHVDCSAKCPGLYSRYYSKYPARYELLAIDAGQSPLTERASALHAALLKKAQEVTVAPQNMPATHILDQCQIVLGEATALLRSTETSDLRTAGSDRDLNARLLCDMKRACNFPHRSGNQ